MKRIPLVLLAIALLCGFAAATLGAEEPVTVKYVVPGNEYAETTKVLAVINEKLLKDGVNVKVQLQYIPWDAWQNKTNIMLSTGEPFDLIHVMENWVPSGVFVGRGAFTPLDDLIDRYGKDMKPLFAGWMWDAMKVDGKVYSVPAYWRDTTNYGGEMGTICVRQDKLRQYGLKQPTNPQELIDTALKMQAKWGKDVYVWEHALSRTPLWLHRTYKTWPFYTEMENPVIKVDQKGNVSSWLESAEFKDDAAYYRSLYTKGLLNPDILSVPKDVSDNILGRQGKFLFGLGTMDWSNGPYDLDKAYVPNVFSLNPEKPALLFLPVLNSNAIPVTSKNPEAAIKFLNWLYKDKKNSDLFCYGVEGVNYKKLAANRIDPAHDANNRPLYQFDWWMIGYYKYQMYNKDALEQEIKANTSSNPNVVQSPVVGFNFNTDAVSSEWANVQAEYKANIVPIRWGVVEYSKAYPAAIAKMKGAGLDKVIAEYKTQLAAFLAKKK